MAWIARNRNGDLYIYEGKPTRRDRRFVCSGDDDYYYIPDWMEEVIMKGRNVLIWEDEPIEI